MKLYINTASNKQTIVKLGNRELIEESSQLHSQVLLKMIQKTLDNLGKKITDITGIEVFTGPGSFTGLRVGVAVANALGYALKIKVNGKDISEKQMVEPIYA